MKNNWITKIFSYALIFIFWSSICFSANYLNLKSFNNFIYGKDIMYLTCFEKSDKPQTGQTIKINSNNKTINDIINFDISSTDNVIKFHYKHPISLALYSINLKSLEFKVSAISNINFEDANIDNALVKNNAFSLLKSNKPNSNFVLNCAIVWSYKLHDNEDKYYNEFLQEASMLSQKPKCSGIGGLGPNDPSLNWNNCVGIKKGSDYVYIGEFVDGYYQGQGIQMRDVNEILVGNFKDDYFHGQGTVFAQAETLFEVSDLGQKKSWILSGKFTEDRWSEENSKSMLNSFKELKFKN